MRLHEQLYLLRLFVLCIDTYSCHDLYFDLLTNTQNHIFSERNSYPKYLEYITLHMLVAIESRNAIAQVN